MIDKKKQNRFRIICAWFVCAVIVLVSAAAAANSATITISGVYNGIPPVAAFTATPQTGIAPLNVVFDSSGSTGTPPLSYLWEFGDGGTSTLQNPSHTYSAGTYTAKLTVTNKAGSSSTTKPITVTAPFTADFTAFQTTCTCSWKVTFNDISTGNPAPTNRAWAYQKAGTTSWTSFGSGAKSPTLSFSSSATYNIRLTVTNGVETKTVIKSITPGTLKAVFSGSPTSGILPFTVTFTDSSVGLPTKWKWEYQKKGTSTWTEFGSGARKPTFTPPAGGKYSIRLTVTNTATTACGSSTVTKTDYITAMDPCDAVVASFTASKTSGYKPLTVKFTDSSTGPVNKWEWDFQNDGTVDSTQQSPTFIYTTKGTYSVKLKVTNICGTGTGTLTRTNYITVK